MTTYTPAVRVRRPPRSPADWPRNRPSPPWSAIFRAPRNPDGTPAGPTDAHRHEGTTGTVNYGATPFAGAYHVWAGWRDDPDLPPREGSSVRATRLEVGPPRGEREPADDFRPVVVADPADPEGTRTRTVLVRPGVRRTAVAARPAQELVARLCDALAGWRA